MTNPSKEGLTEQQWIQGYATTWKEEDGKYLSIAFYRLLEGILSLEVSRSQAEITANTLAEQCMQTPAEKKRITSRIEQYRQAQIPLKKLKQ
ncbi:MAG: hypothetical protein JEY71_07695 [Sphaerochaeta sp.]|nr:hypothetical protein [Sphaerochaeta sp.]